MKIEDYNEAFNMNKLKSENVASLSLLLRGCCIKCNENTTKLHQFIVLFLLQQSSTRTL